MAIWWRKQPAVDMLSPLVQLSDLWSHTLSYRLQVTQLTGQPPYRPTSLQDTQLTGHPAYRTPSLQVNCHNIICESHNTSNIHKGIPTSNLSARNGGSTYIWQDCFLIHTEEERMAHPVGGVCERRNSLRPQSQWRQCCTPIQGPSAEQVVVCVEEASTA